MPIVCPVGDQTLAGVGIFDAGIEETRQIVDGDPGVQAGIFVAEVHACRSFPGDALSGPTQTRPLIDDEEFHARGSD